MVSFMFIYLKYVFMSFYNYIMLYRVTWNMCDISDGYGVRPSQDFWHLVDAGANPLQVWKRKRQESIETS